MVEGTGEIVKKLKKRGYVVGIISDSYSCITNHVKNRLGMDFALANELEFSQNICTGEVKIPGFFFSNETSSCTHTVCKTNALLNLLKKFAIKLENCIAVGDNINDMCMLSKAGTGISFCSKNALVNRNSDVIISDRSFEKILQFA
jgi:HAD superfamily phosphoserine phosphatase-like hydrolase